MAALSAAHSRIVVLRGCGGRVRSRGLSEGGLRGKGLLRLLHLAILRSRLTKTCRLSRAQEVRASSGQGGGGGDGRAGSDPEFAVFRFTLGIPGFDDGDLPRVVGLFLAVLLILNHVLSPGKATATQWRSEVVGILLSAAAIAVPSVGRKLKGSGNRGLALADSGPGNNQMFGLQDGLEPSARENLAWVSYSLLRNTSTTALLVSKGGHIICARGSWKSQQDPGQSKTRSTLSWLQKQMELLLSEAPSMKDAVQRPGSASLLQGQSARIFQRLVPHSVETAFVQAWPPSTEAGSELDQGINPGYLLLLSPLPNAFSRRDEAWAATMACKLAQVLSVSMREQSN